MRATPFFAALVFLLPVLAWAGLQPSSWNSLSEEQKELVEQAFSARKNAYAPYSNYQVGVALKTVNGQVFTGANVENASYGLTVCAERAAVFKSVSEGQVDIKMMALVTRDGGMPCGACRQVIREFNPNAQIIVTDAARKKVSIVSLKELLPESFGPHNL